MPSCSTLANAPTRRARSRSLVIAITGVPLTIGGLLLACSEPTYLFLGRRYDPVLQCLDTTTSLDVLRGGDPGDCATRCVSAPPGFYDLDDASTDTFVVVMCAPLPHDVTDMRNDDPQCVAALAAMARQDTCLSDGGSTAPPVDAGPDADATSDSNASPNPSDAAADAGSD